MSDPKSAALPELPVDLQQQLVGAAMSVCAQWLSNVAGGRTVIVLCTDGDVLQSSVHGMAAKIRAALPKVGPALEGLAAQMEKGSGN